MGLDRCPTAAQILRRISLRARVQQVINPIAVDAVLQSHGINNAEDPRQSQRPEAGQMVSMRCGHLRHRRSLRGLLLGLVSGYQVGVIRGWSRPMMAKRLMRSSGSRYSLNVMPAHVDGRHPDQLGRVAAAAARRGARPRRRRGRARTRDSNPAFADLANAACDECAPPRARSGRNRRRSYEFSQAVYRMRCTPYVAPPPSANEIRFLDAVAIGDDPDARRSTAVDEDSQHLNTASSWHPAGSQRSVSYSSQSQR